jgi:DNA-binding NarL/FixJ family response regulator
VRIVVADDAFLLREGMAHALAKMGDLEIVRTCEDRDSLLRAIDEEQPDVVLTDIRMPPTGTSEGIQVARILSDTHPRIGVVVLSQFVESSYVLALLERGSARRGYLLKQRLGRLHQLVGAIRTVAAGGSFIDPEVVEVLVQARARMAPLSELTPREREVLSEIAQGKSNPAIADALALTKRGVEAHIASIFMKLQLGNPEDVSRRVKATLLFLAGERA